MSTGDRILAQRVVAELQARGLAPLLRRVCAARGVTEAELCSRCRTRSVAIARQELWWRIRAQPDRDYSYSEIARMFERDPTTVISGAAAHQRRARDCIGSTFAASVGIDDLPF